MDNNRDNNNNYESVEYLVEDTARLLEEAASKSKKKMIILIAAVAIAVIAIITGIVIKHVLDGGNDQPAVTAEEDQNKADRGSADEDNEGAVAGENDSEPEAEETDLSGVYAAYAQILEDNSDGIRSYYWQLGADGDAVNYYDYSADGSPIILDDPANKCVAVHDLNGDGVPELLFFATDENYIAVLHIYTYVDGAAKECWSDIDSDSDPSGNLSSGYGLFSDIAVAAGTNYMVYTGRKTGTFYIAYSMGDEIMNYSSIQLFMDKDGNINSGDHVRNSVGPNDDYTGTIDKYYSSDSEISSDKGAEMFRNAADEYSRLIMFSGNLSDTIRVFKHVEEDEPLAMTYYEALRKLES